jgi:hypothetical protein
MSEYGQIKGFINEYVTKNEAEGTTGINERMKWSE